MNTLGRGTVSRAMLLVIACLILCATAQAADWYVSPIGSGSGDGSMGDPWDFGTAMVAPSEIQPGDTVWVRGGYYLVDNDTNCYLEGTAGNPVIIRQYPGERAIIDLYENGIIYVKGSYNWWWGLEIMSTSTDRMAGSDVRDIDRGYGIYFSNGDGPDMPGQKGINLVQHDAGANIGFWRYAIDGELYGNLIYHNGYDWTDRGHGHGIYSQNYTGRKLIKHNVIWGQYGHGIQIYGGSGYRNNYDIEQNVMFNNGVPSTISGSQNAIVCSGGERAYDVNVIENHAWRNPEVDTASMFRFGNAELVDIQDNYIIGVGSAALYVYTDASLGSLEGNKMVGTLSGVNIGSWPNNYYSSSTMPSTDAVFVYPNAYEAGRGMIVVWNFSGQTSVQVDLSGLGLDVGDDFFIRDAENFYGAPAVYGTYDGSLVTLPVDQTEISELIGTPGDQTPHTPLTFGTYLVIPAEGVGDGSPAITAGPFALPNPIIASGSADFAVYASDADGYPDPLTYTWSIQSGPAGGTTTFTPNGTTDADNCTATFNTAGTYVIEVAVSDGDNITTGTMVLDVHPVGAFGWPIPGKFEAEDFVAQADNDVITGTDIHGVERTWLGTDQFSWSEYDIIVTEAGDYIFGAEVHGIGNNRRFQTWIDGVDYGLTFYHSDLYPEWEYVLINDGNPITLSEGVHRVKIVNEIRGRIDFFAAEADFTTNTPPEITAGPTVTPDPVTAGAPATATVTATDAGGPSPISYQWLKVDGPLGGTVSFSPNNAANADTTTATFSDAGTYTLRVLITDGQFLTVGEVEVTVDPSAGNQAPQIDSAASATPNPVTLPNTSALTVTASDPDSGPSALTYTWSVTSGPAGTSFSPNGTTDADATTATFATDGSYEIEVMVSDGADTATSSVTVEVDPEPNQPPVIDTEASAAPSPAYTNQDVTFSVTAHDPDGDPASLTYTWEITDGPAGAVFTPNGTSDADSALASFSAVGTYTARVTVKDTDEDEATSTVTIEVNPSPDIDGSGSVDLLDFYLLRQAFGTSDPLADLDENGTVDLLDFYILRQNFGPFPQ